MVTPNVSGPSRAVDSLRAATETPPNCLSSRIEDRHEKVMSRLGLHPDLPGAASLVDRYEAVNPVLLGIAAALEIDLGLLDSLWWRVQPQDLAATAVPRARAR